MNWLQVANGLFSKRDNQDQQEEPEELDPANDHDEIDPAPAPISAPPPTDNSH